VQKVLIAAMFTKNTEGRQNGDATVNATVSKKGRGKRPAKPWRTFPLYAHASGQWAKAILGKTYYFGPWHDPNAALEKFNAAQDFLYTGRPVPPEIGGATLEEVANRWLEAQWAAHEQGRLTRAHWLDCQRDAVRLLKILPRQQPAASLDPGAFRKLRSELSQGRNATTLSGILARLRSMFRWAKTMDILEDLPHYAGEFSMPAARSMRLARAARGKMDFTAADVRAILAAAEPLAPLVAMVWLGINAGLGNTDCATLKESHLDVTVDGGAWLDFPRQKTGAPRRAWLWPETVQAIEAAIERRDAMMAKDDDAGKAWPAKLEGRVFVTRHRRPYVAYSAKGNPLDAIATAFGRILDGLDLHTPGRGFYCLRRTFRTVADAVGDWPAIDLAMGHLPSDVAGAPFAIEMAARYRGRIDDARMQAVADHVHTWLLDPSK